MGDDLAALPTAELEARLAEVTQRLQDVRHRLSAVRSELDAVDAADQDKLVDRGIRYFNLNPAKGLRFLGDEGVVRPPGDAAAEAQFLRETPGLSKSRVGEWLGEPDAHNVETLREFALLFDFAGRPFEEALRGFLAVFRLPGESQKIERIVEAFGQAFYRANPGVFRKEDVATVLAYSTIMLNTATHRPGLKPSERMTREQFVRNNRGIDDGADLPQALLEALFDGIAAQEIETDCSHDENGNLFANPDCTGFLKKQGGSYKGWQKRWFMLSGNVLYYFKARDDITPRGFFPLENVVVLRQQGKEIVLGDAHGRTMKSAKYNSAGEMVHGNHKRCTLRADTVEEASRWVGALHNSTSGGAV